MLFTCSPDEEADARRLDINRVVLSTDSERMKATANQFDLAIDTVPYVHDLDPYIPTLALSGALVLVGHLGTLDPLLNTVPLILGRKSVAGSTIGGVAETQGMTDFCGQHDITTDIEVIDIQDINHAWQRMLKNGVKYHFTIDITSLK